MKSRTAEVDVAEAHRAMPALGRLSDGSRVHANLPDWIAAFARDSSQSMEAALVAER
jgi:hypothetical protein